MCLCYLNPFLCCPCMLTNISTLAANSIFPIVRCFFNCYQITATPLLFMCLCCLNPFLCSCMLATILAHATNSIFPLMQSTAILCLQFIFYRACLICTLMPMIRIIIRPSKCMRMLMTFYILQLFRTQCISALFYSIPLFSGSKINNTCETTTVFKCRISNTFYTIRNRYAFKTTTVIKCNVSNTCYTIWNCYTFKTTTVFKYIYSNTFYTIRNRYTCEITTSRKCIRSNTCYTIWNRYTCETTTVFKYISSNTSYTIR